MNAHDFSLEILVDVPDDGPPRVRVHVDEHAATRPFNRVAPPAVVDRRPLPGVDPRPAAQRAAVTVTVPDGDPAQASAAAAPLSSPRHAWLTPSGRHPVPSRQRARSLLGVPPPPPARATPLSDEDAARMARRTRTLARSRWAQSMLARLFRD